MPDDLTHSLLMLFIKSPAPIGVHAPTVDMHESGVNSYPSGKKLFTADLAGVVDKFRDRDLCGDVEGCEFGVLRISRSYDSAIVSF